MHHERNGRHRGSRRAVAAAVMFVVAASIGAVGGALVAYLLDPARGRARRRELRDRSAATARRQVKRVQRRSGQRLAYARGRALRIGHRLGRHGPPVDDRTLVDKVRSEVLGRQRFHGYSLNVDAADGVVVLRGQVDEGEGIRELVGAVAKVPGVRRVENLLHTPHTTAPNVLGLQRPGD